MSNKVSANRKLASNQKYLKLGLTYNDITKQICNFSNKEMEKACNYLFSSSFLPSLEFLEDFPTKC